MLEMQRKQRLELFYSAGQDLERFQNSCTS